MAAPFIAKMLGGKVAQRFGKQQAGEIISDFIVNETTEKAEEVKEGIGDKLTNTVDNTAQYIEDVLEKAPEVVTENGIEVELPQKINDAVDNTADTTENKLVHNGLKTAEELPNAIKNGINSIPIIGGIGLLLGIILFILFALKPIDGMEDEEGNPVTRLKLIWRVLIGRAELNEEVTEGEETDTPNTKVETAINVGSYVLEKEIPIALDVAQFSINPWGNIIKDQVSDLIRNYSNFGVD